MLFHMKTRVSLKNFYYELVIGVSNILWVIVAFIWLRLSFKGFIKVLSLGMKTIGLLVFFTLVVIMADFRNWTSLLHLKILFCWNSNILYTIQFKIWCWLDMKKTFISKKEATSGYRALFYISVGVSSNSVNNFARFFFLLLLMSLK